MEKSGCNEKLPEQRANEGGREVAGQFRGTWVWVPSSRLKQDRLANRRSASEKGLQARWAEEEGKRMWVARDSIRSF